MTDIQHSTSVNLDTDPGAIHRYLHAAKPAKGGREWIVDQTHRQADDEGPGERNVPLKSIAAAALRAEAGDVVTVRQGVYRERVAPRRGGAPGRPIVYQAMPGERVVITGARPWRPTWTPVESKPRVFRGELASELFRITDPQREDWPNMPQAYNPFALPLSAAPSSRGRTVDLFGQTHGESVAVNDPVIGQVFSGDEPMLQVCEADALRRLPGTWQVESDGQAIRLHLPIGVEDPDSLDLEVTVDRCAFAPWRRGLGYIHVRGFIMERSASDFPSGFYREGQSPQAGVVSTRSGHHWVIEHNVIRDGTSLGLDIGTEGREDGDELDQPRRRGDAGHHLIQHNLICNHGAGGIAGLGSTATRILHNRIEGTNRLGFTAPETGGIKVHHFLRGRIEGNLIRGNHCYGIWLDNMWRHARVTRNAVINNAGAGIFLELGNGPLTVDHNVVALTRPGVREPGDGIYSHDASGILLAHNLVIDNAHFGLWAHAATDRRCGVYDEDDQRVGRSTACCSNWHITQNLFISNHAGEIALPPEHGRATGNRCDANALAGTFDRWTHETYGAAMDAPRFGLCDNKGRVDRRTLIEHMIERLKESGVDESHLPSVERLLADPHLTLGEWRCATDFDLNSVEVKVIRPDTAAGVATVSFMVGPQLGQAPTSRLEGLDHDYHGQPLPERPLPGPFQNLRMDPELTGNPAGVAPWQSLVPKNLNYLHLWPIVPGDGPDDDTNTHREGGKA